MIFRGFLCFLPFFPLAFRSAGVAAAVTKCACRERSRGKGEGDTRSRVHERTYADALTTYRSRLPFFFVRPESPKLSTRSLVVRSFLSSPPALPLTININLWSAHRESIEITGRILVFCFPPSVVVGIRADTQERVWHKRKTFARTLSLSMFHGGKIDPVRRFIRPLPATKEFSIRNFTNERTEREREKAARISYSVAITRCFMIPPASDNHDSRFG